MLEIIQKWARMPRKSHIGRYYLPVINNDYYPRYQSGGWMIVDPNKPLNDCIYCIIWFDDGNYAIAKTGANSNWHPRASACHAIIGCLEYEDTTAGNLQP